MSNRGTWKIVIGSTTFADYTDVVDPLESGGLPIIQKDDIYGAADSANRAKGNFTRNVSFYFLIEQADNKASADFFMGAADEFNGVATAVISHTDYSGTETAYTLTGCTVEVKPAKPRGVTNEGTITFTGGVKS